MTPARRHVIALAAAALPALLSYARRASRFGARYHAGPTAWDL
jgi:hypothetical protein